MIKKRFLLISLLLCLSFSINGQVKDKFTLVLDAGHGGTDGGAKGVNGMREKDITLDITLMLGREIEKKLPDVNVVYTRKTDVFIPLYQRASIANKNKANLFISIHCNAANSSAKGTETFVLGLHREEDNLEVAKRENSVILLEDDYKAKYEGYNPNNPASIIGFMLAQNVHLSQSIRLAQLIELAFVKDGRQSRGVKQAGFLVIRETAMPSVLIEIGFITNQEEGTFLDKYLGRRKTVLTLYDAFKKYKEEFDLKNKDQSGLVLKEVETEKPIKEASFRVQFLVSKHKYTKNSPYLKGIKDFDIVEENGLYKYYYGNTSYVSKKQANLDYVKSIGFYDAFIVDVNKIGKNNETTVAGRYFTVQVFISRKKYDLDHRKFKGLKNIRAKKENGIWKYYYGKTNTYSEAIILWKKVSAVGLKKAVIKKKQHTIL